MRAEIAAVAVAERRWWANGELHRLPITLHVIRYHPKVQLPCNLLLDDDHYHYHMACENGFPLVNDEDYQSSIIACIVSSFLPGLPMYPALYKRLILEDIYWTMMRQLELVQRSVEFNHSHPGSLVCGFGFSLNFLNIF